MKRTLVFVVALFLTCSLTWAEGGSAGGGCMLPDAAGLTPDQFAVAALAAGFEMSSATAAAIPVCPVTFNCNSLANCAAGKLCILGNIGPCCTKMGGTFCCNQGNIWVQECPCVCTGFACSRQCEASTDVQWSCF